MNHVTNRLTFLLVVAISVTGCSSVVRDMYYAQESVPPEWRGEFIPGRTSTKQAGGADQVLFTYTNDNLELSIHSEYQRVVTWGPLWFALIPTGGWGQSDGNIFLRVYGQAKRKETGLEIDPLQWVVGVNGDEKRLLSPELVSEHQFEGVDYFVMKYPIKFSSVQTLTIRFRGVTSDGSDVNIPPLKISKKKGSLRFEQFTL